MIHEIQLANDPLQLIREVVPASPHGMNVTIEAAVPILAGELRPENGDGLAEFRH